MTYQPAERIPLHAEKNFSQQEQYRPTVPNPLRQSSYLTAMIQFQVQPKYSSDCNSLELESKSVHFLAALYRFWQSRWQIHMCCKQHAIELSQLLYQQCMALCSQTSTTVMCGTCSMMPASDQLQVWLFCKEADMHQAAVSGPVLFSCKAQLQ